MDGKINITDESLLKITRVRLWAICFDYDGKHYLLHGKSELGEGSWQELFEKVYDENGRYELIHMNNSFAGTDAVANEYIKRQKGKTIVYKNIDKPYFIRKLVEHDFSTGLYAEEAEKEKDRMENVQELWKDFLNLKDIANNLSYEDLMKLRKSIQRLKKKYS